MKKRRNMVMKQRGSAILIAVFLITAIGGLAFSFGRIFLLEGANASIFESGIGAYYSAESGIEEAFLRYRYDRFAEVPYGNNNLANYWKLDQDQVFRTDLSGGTVDTGGASNVGIDKSGTSITDDSKQYYDLRMGFIGTFGKSFYGHSTDSFNTLSAGDFLTSNYTTGDYSVLHVVKDDTVKIDFSDKMNIGDPLNDPTLFANYYPDSTTGLINEDQAIMYVRVVVDDSASGGTVKEYKAMLAKTKASACTALGRSADSGCEGQIMVVSPLNLGVFGRYAWSYQNVIRNLLSTVSAPAILSSSKVTLFLRPLFSDADIGMVTAGCAFGGCDHSTKTAVMPGPYTEISSTGYYGGVTRTIRANLDRQSGTLYDLYDYVIYQIQP
jgi:hypothetical protein